MNSKNISNNSGKSIQLYSKVVDTPWGLFGDLSMDKSSNSQWKLSWSTKLRYFLLPNVIIVSRLHPLSYFQALFLNYSKGITWSSGNEIVHSDSFVSNTNWQILCCLELLYPLIATTIFLQAIQAVNILSSQMK